MWRFRRYTGHYRPVRNRHWQSPGQNHKQLPNSPAAVNGGGTLCRMMAREMSAPVAALSANAAAPSAIPSAAEWTKIPTSVVKPTICEMGRSCLRCSDEKVANRNVRDFGCEFAHKGRFSRRPPVSLYANYLNQGPHPPLSGLASRGLEAAANCTESRANMMRKPATSASPSSPCGASSRSACPPPRQRQRKAFQAERAA
jgi:hypothetical protein